MFQSAGSALKNGSNLNMPRLDDAPAN